MRTVQYVCFLIPQNYRYVVSWSVSEKISEVNK